MENWTRVSRLRPWHVAVFCAAIFMAGMMAPTLTTAQSSSKEEVYRQLGLFGDIFQRVRESYVDEIDDGELIEAAITGMLTSLDPHSTFLDTENFSEMQEQTKGRFGGLGVEITMDQGMVKVVSPIDDTPAAGAGLQPEDYLIAVDDVSIIGMQLSEAVEKLRGEVGSKVTIKVQRGQLEPFDVTIIRDFIKIRSVRSEIFDGIGYVRLTTFSEQTTPGLIEAVDNFFREGLRDLLPQGSLETRHRRQAHQIGKEIDGRSELQPIGPWISKELIDSFEALPIPQIGKGGNK